MKNPATVLPRPLPTPVRDANLPIAAHWAQLQAALLAHPVIIVCGATGSGKTTQLPQLCLALGRGSHGLIGHTQPRRIAARSVAQRLADSLQSAVGQWVGCQVRFNAQVGPQCCIKLMTDGILLAELQRDPLLRHYDTLIIDEAHERTLNIDFLLGYCKQLLPKRPDLKIIVTSATIDTEKFSRYFNQAPIIEVGGRTYPIEVRYRPLPELDPEEQDDGQSTAICAAVAELDAEAPGDILVFLSGEREIRDAVDALHQQQPHLMILPLYARLSQAEQHKIFQPQGQQRRVILATNIAETSLTVPGIRYVVDSGLARISRYSPRAKIKRLPIEPIAQANAEQRKGRCGRVAPGICIRLYAQEDFQQRPLFLEPELLRSHLAEVILRMQALHLGDIEAFDFLDPPQRQSVRDGLQLLQELGALTAQGELTEMGQQLAQLPLEPRLGRILLEARRRHVLREGLILAAALSLPDPRERPFNQLAAADLQHQQFFLKEDKSDFRGLLRLWDFWQTQQTALSHGQQRKLCQRLFLSYSRLREWQAVRQQLEEALDELFSLQLNSLPADDAALHQSLLAGLLGHIGLWHTEQQHYRGVRGQRFWPFPGSVLARKPPLWLMAAELTETSKLYARLNAQIDPAWIEQAAAHLLQKHYLEPHWQETQGNVGAYLQLSLHQLVVVARRRVDYGRINPEVAREIFIQAGLVEGRYAWQTDFWRHNQEIMAQLQIWEAKLRVRGLAGDPAAHYAWYAARLPATVTNVRRCLQWLQQVGDTRLRWQLPDWLPEAWVQVRPTDYPDTCRINDVALPVRYRYAPGEADDGAVLDVPLAMLNQLRLHTFNALIPGWLPAKLEALLRQLPKPTRIKLQPLKDAVAHLQRVIVGASDLTAALSLALQRHYAVTLAPEQLTALETQLPPELRLGFRLLDAQGQTLALSRSLPELQRQYGARAKLAVAGSFADLPRTGLKRWDFGDLPPQLAQLIAGVNVPSFPALVDSHETVKIQVFDNQAEAEHNHRQGVLRLLILEHSSQWTATRRQLTLSNPGALAWQRLLGSMTLADWNIALSSALFNQAFLSTVALPYRQADYLALKSSGLKRLPELLRRWGAWQTRLIPLAEPLTRRLQAAVTWKTAVQDIHNQFAYLWAGSTLTQAAWYWLERYPVYLQAVHLRLERLALKPQRDAEQMQRFQPLYQWYLTHGRSPRWARLPPDSPLRDYPWLLEELRLTLYVPGLKPIREVTPESLMNLWRLLD